MRLPALPSWVPVAAVAGAFVAWSLWRDARRDRALDALTTAVAGVAAERRVVDSVYRTATVVATRTRTRYETLRDTLTVTDTVRVREALAAADTALAACRAVVLTCERRVRLADSAAALWERRADLAEQGPRVAYSAGAAWDLTARAVEAQAGVALRVLGPVRATAAIQHTFAPNESPRLLVGGNVTF